MAAIFEILIQHFGDIAYYQILFMIKLKNTFEAEYSLLYYSLF